MVRSTSARRTSTQNGLSIDKQHKDSFTVVASFFKVMISADFSEVMLLPPKFARIVTDLIDQRIQLEDLVGLKWTVTLSRYKGFLAFEKGWHAFSEDHAVALGDVLVFEYIRHAHFLVKIFGKSACEKLSFPENKGSERKRKRNNERYSGNDKFLCKSDCDTMNKQSTNDSAVSVPDIEISGSPPMPVDISLNTDNDKRIELFSKMNCYEEPFYMSNKDNGVGKCEYRDSLYDLASFEMRPSAVCGTGVNDLENEIFHGQIGVTPNSEGEVGTVGKVSLTKEVQNCVPTPQKLEIKQNYNDALQMDNGIPIEKDKSEQDTGKPIAKNNSMENDGFPIAKNNFGGDKGTPSVKNNSNDNYVGLEQYETDAGKNLFTVSQEPLSRVSSGQSFEKKFSAGLEFSGLPISRKPEIYSFGKSLKVVKQEQLEMGEEDYVNGVKPGYNGMMKFGQSSYPKMEVNNNFPVMVKPEPVDTTDIISYAFTVKIPFSEANGELPYLELPARLLPVSSRAKFRTEWREIVYLQDSASRTWPVLYHERFGNKVLTSGWEAFRKANRIVPGDECEFNLVDYQEFIFRVGVLRK